MYFSSLSSLLGTAGQVNLWSSVLSKTMDNARCSMTAQVHLTLTHADPPAVSEPCWQFTVRKFHL